MTKARVWSEEECNWLKENIIYDPETGVLTWVKKVARHVRIGDEVGRIGSNGYRMFNLTIGGKRLGYRSHRVAWYLYYGSFPSVLDHINNISLDNRVGNLREATLSQNSGNSCLRKNNTSGAKGVTINRGKYCARIYIKGNSRHLGSYSTLEGAARAYDEAAIEQWGEFAYTNKDHGVY